MRTKPSVHTAYLKNYDNIKNLCYEKDRSGSWDRETVGWIWKVTMWRWHMMRSKWDGTSYVTSDYDNGKEGSRLSNWVPGSSHPEGPQASSILYLLSLSMLPLLCIQKIHIKMSLWPKNPNINSAHIWGLEGGREAQGNLLSVNQQKTAN